MNTYNFERWACTSLGGGIFAVITWVILSLTGQCIGALPMLIFFTTAGVVHVLTRPLFERQQIRDLLAMRAAQQHTRLEHEELH